MSKPTLARNSCDCVLNTFLPITKYGCKFNVKVSYSCMSNMSAIISRHNKITICNGAAANSTTPPRNCRNKASYPLERKCRKSCIVYKACSISGNAAYNYYSCCKTEFKPRFCNQASRKNNITELSKVFWQAKDGIKIPALNGTSRPIQPIPTGGKIMQSVSHRKTDIFMGGFKLNPQQKDGPQRKMSTCEQI